MNKAGGANDEAREIIKEMQETTQKLGKVLKKQKTYQGHTWCCTVHPDAM